METRQITIKREQKLGANAKVLPIYKLTDKQSEQLTAILSARNIESKFSEISELLCYCAEYQYSMEGNFGLTNSQLREKLNRLKNTIHKGQEILTELPCIDEMVIDQLYYSANNRDRTLIDVFPKQHEFTSGCDAILNRIEKALESYLNNIQENSSKTDQTYRQALDNLAVGYKKILGGKRPFSITSDPKSLFYELTSFWLSEILGGETIDVRRHLKGLLKQYSY